MRIFLTAVATCVLAAGTALAQAGTGSGENTGSAAGICIGSGEPGGRYHAFAERLIEAGLEGSVCNTPTAGSLENLRGLREGRLAFAIAQNDLAYHQFTGGHGLERWQDFAAVAPLFPEFVQVFVRQEDNAPDLFGELRGRRINIGVHGSGSTINARDVLAAAGLREGVDYLPANHGMREAFAALGENEVDAVFVTAGENFEFDADRFSRLAVPPSIITQLANENPYYESSGLEIDGRIQPSLATRAVLLARRDAPREVVGALTGTLLAIWPGLQEDVGGLYPPEDFVTRLAVDFHPAARAVLVERGHAAAPPRYWLWLIAWGALLASSVAAISMRTTYDRTGEARARDRRLPGVQQAIDLWARPSPWFIGISLFAIILCGAFIALRTAEAMHARAFNLDNPFGDLAFMEGIVWMLAFVASGFTENDAYPLSPPGRVMMACLALLGIGGPITAIIVTSNFIGRQRAARAAGWARTKWHDHILVCGWNEHLSGVVYSLTGQDAAERYKVCMVAQSGDASPMDGHHFNPKRVRFRRGDSADRKTLEEAGARRASHAIILADYERRESQNIGAILTAMNLKRLNPDIRISAELNFNQNADHFASFGCDTLITPDLFIAKAAALSTIHPLMVDYLLEVLTYDEFDEIYAVEYGELCDRHPGYGPEMALCDVEREIWRSGANLIGVVRGDLKREAVYDAEVEDGGPIISLTREAGYDYVPARNDRIIYAAHTRDTILKPGHRQTVLDAAPIPRDLFSFSRPEGTRILIYASEEHVERLEKNLRAFHRDPQICVVTIESTPFLTRNVLAERLDGFRTDCGVEAFDYAIVLADAKKKRNASSSARVRAADAHTLLATKLIRQIADSSGWTCKIIAEAIAREDRDAFLGPQFSQGQDLPVRETASHAGAGANAVIPSATLVERFLVKDVFDGNSVLDFLIAVMNMRDGTHLYMKELAAGDPLIGQSYASLVRTRHAGLHLVGWLPVTQRDTLRNRKGDFDFHFRTCYNDKIEQDTLQQGDLLVFTACFGIWEGGTGEP